MPQRIFKGPLFASHRSRQRSLTELPVARGVIDAQSFVKSERPMIDEVIIDECKEVSPDDFEKLRSRTAPPGIQTAKNNNWIQYI
jgi:hypothetical protein